MVLNMFHGTLQPLAGASRTLSQLSEDGLLPRCSAAGPARDVPWVATAVTAGMSIVFLLIGDPVWMIAAANLTYLIGIALPSVAVWLLRRHSPDLHRPYRAPRGMIGLGLSRPASGRCPRCSDSSSSVCPRSCSAWPWPTRVPALYACATWRDRRRGAASTGIRNSLHKKLTGAMLLVMTAGQRRLPDRGRTASTQPSPGWSPRSRTSSSRVA